jgi:hypothetical protein
MPERRRRRFAAVVGAWQHHDAGFRRRRLCPPRPRRESSLRLSERTSRNSTGLTASARYERLRGKQKNPFGDCPETVAAAQDRRHNAWSSARAAASCTRYTSRRGRPARADALDTCGSIRSASWAQPLRMCCAWLAVRFSRDIALREDARDRFGLAFDHLKGAPTLRTVSRRTPQRWNFTCDTFRRSRASRALRGVR